MKKIIAVIVCIVCALSLAGCAGKEKVARLAEQPEAEMAGAEGNAAMDGEITEQCGSSEVPAKNNQSNFGTGYGYQYGSAEGTIEVLLDDGNWYIFAEKEVKDAGSYR